MATITLRFPCSVVLAISILGSIAGAAPQCPAMERYAGPGDVGTPTGPSPTGPTPAGPGAPSPTGPGTPGPTTSGRGLGPKTPRGTVVPMTRQSTAIEILNVDWDYAVASAFGKDKGRTFVSSDSYAWPVARAFKKIAGDDPRPLLVLRECRSCRGTEHALFSRRFSNEKTQLLLNWFHCVKLPPAVVKKNHPFHNLFHVERGRRPHLFICTRDGRNKKLFTGAQPQSLLQRELTELLRITYEKQPRPAIQSMIRLLAKFDMYDLRERELLDQLDRATEKSGSKSAKSKKVRKALAKVRRAKTKAMNMAKAVCDLKLKVTKAAKAAKAAKTAKTAKTAKAARAAKFTKATKR